MYPLYHIPGLPGSSHRSYTVYTHCRSSTDSLVHSLRMGFRPSRIPSMSRYPGNIRDPPHNSSRYIPHAPDTLYTRLRHNTGSYYGSTPSLPFLRYALHSYYYRSRSRPCSLHCSDNHNSSLPHDTGCRGYTQSIRSSLRSLNRSLQTRHYSLPFRRYMSHSLDNPYIFLHTLHSTGSSDNTSSSRRNNNHPLSRSHSHYR